MKEILFKIRKNYEQNRKFCVVKVETLSKINNRGRGAGKCPRTCTIPNIYKRLASIFESLQINSVYGWYFTLLLYEGRNRATS